MARIAGIDLPQHKQVWVGLTYIYGIGRTRSHDILQKAEVAAGRDYGPLVIDDPERGAEVCWEAA